MTGPEAQRPDVEVDIIHDRLMGRLIELQFGIREQVERLDALRRSTRQELWRRLAMAREYAEAHFGSPLTVADLAHVACLSEHHFKRSFRAAFGVPPHRYLRNLRIAHAKRMLQAGDVPVHAIALAVGYADTSAFIRAFKQDLGHTPLSFPDHSDAFHDPSTPLLTSGSK